MNLLDFFQFERKIGSPIYQQNGRTIRPISHILSLWWRPLGGSVHNFPVAVQIEENGTIREEPIINLTFYARTAFALLTILFTLLIWTVSSNKN